MNLINFISLIKHNNLQLDVITINILDVIELKCLYSRLYNAFTFFSFTPEKVVLCIIIEFHNYYCFFEDVKVSWVNSTETTWQGIYWMPLKIVTAVNHAIKRFSFATENPLVLKTFKGTQEVPMSELMLLRFQDKN